MNKFNNAMRVAFVGRIAGALGVTYEIQDTVEYASHDSMTLALYEGRTGSGKKYERVSNVRTLDTIYTEDSLTKVKNDVNGNPRYVIHFLALLTKAEKDAGLRYEHAIAKAKKLIGGRKFHNKQYGGGIVFTSYNVRDELDVINAMHRNA